MGLGSFLTGSTDKMKPVDVREQWQKDIFKNIGEASEAPALESLNRAGEAYGGDLSSPLSTFEEQGFKGLEDYLNSPLPTESDIYQLGRSEITNTLEGEYDPYEGEYYKAYKSNLARELQEAQDKLAARTSASDQFFGGGRIKEEGNLQESAMGDLAQMLGSLYESERGRRADAVPMATQMATYENLAPLQRIETAMGYGSLPRQLEQADLDRQYSEYQRQLSSLQPALQTAYNTGAHTPSLYYPQYSSTPGLLGGPSGVSSQSNGGVNSDIMVAQSMASLFSGMGA